MSSWVRRHFDGIGLTQSPPGPHLAALQAKYGGTVLLCIDVSGSMSGKPLRQAIAGGEQFLKEADEAHYRCGLVLWDHRVHRYVPPDVSLAEVLTGLRSATIAGGTELAPTLRLGIEVLGPLTGDRVMCVFSDGGLGDRKAALSVAAEARAMGIRILVRGLGRGTAEALAEIASPDENEKDHLIEDVSRISSGIASMATGLAARRRGL